MTAQHDTSCATSRSLTDAAWLSAGALPRLLVVLDSNGEEARVVGGAVRNALARDTDGALLMKGARESGLAGAQCQDAGGFGQPTSHFPRATGGFG